MSQIVPLVPPRENGVEVVSYITTPRSKRSFNTILDASRIFSAGGRSTVVTTVSGEGAERRVVIKTDHPLQGGAITETLELKAGGHLAPLRLERKLTDLEGFVSRE